MNRRKVLNRLKFARAMIKARFFYHIGGFTLLFSITTGASADDQNDSWRGSVRTKVQTDNRYNLDGDYTGEVWGQMVYTNPNQKINGNMSVLSRLSTDIYRDRQEVYQAFAEKKFDRVPLTLRGGRFEKSDNLGLYLVDGAVAKYQLSQPISVEVYGGRPLRIDHVQSIRGSLVAGVESLFQLTPHFTSGVLGLDNTDVGLGMQTVERNEISVIQNTNPELVVDENFDVVENTNISTSQINKTLTTYRFNSHAHLKGYLLNAEKPFEMYIKGSYASEKNRLENVFVDTWWDVFKDMRLRNYYEAYRPQQYFVTFRDRFYSAYALGEQQIWRGSMEQRYSQRLRYSAGIQFADREIGESGQGYNANISYQWQPNLTTQATVDYLELSGGDYAASLYLSNTHAIDSKNRYSVNFALREEQKSLYGENVAAGIETEWQTMVKNNWVVALKASYINNTNDNARNEYLGSAQLTYYFDYFQAKKP